MKHIHIIAIGGTAMASFAGMLKEKGFHVTGSDFQIYPPMSTLLEKLQIKVFEGYKAENIDCNPDLVIIGNTIRADNPEVLEVKRRNIPFKSFPEFLKEIFLMDKEVLVIAGTHGKTTTTSLASWVFCNYDKNSSFLVGGISLNFNQSFIANDGKYFVIEGDEYGTSFFDKGPKFLHYNPKYLIMTGIEFDHADIFSDVSVIEEQFRKLVKLLPADGIILVNGENEKALNIAKLANCKVETYGVSENTYNWYPDNIKCDSTGVTFELFHNKTSLGLFKTTLFGNHNLMNVLSVLAIVINLDFDMKNVRQSLTTFKGVKRRQEVIAEINGIPIIDDFAHHPTAILETIKAIKMKYPGRKVWSVFEPRTNTMRRNVLTKDLENALETSDYVVIAPAFKPEAIPEEQRFNSEDSINRLKKRGVKAYYFTSTDEISKGIASMINPQDVILIMSNGGFDNIYSKLQVDIKQRYL